MPVRHVEPTPQPAQPAAPDKVTYAGERGAATYRGEQIKEVDGASDHEPDRPSEA